MSNLNITRRNFIGAASMSALGLVLAACGGSKSDAGSADAGAADAAAPEYTLVKEGKLYRVQGKGTYVAEQKIEAMSLYYVGIREQLEQMGYEVSTKTIECGIIPSDSNVARHLNLKEGTPVYRIKRVRSISKKGPVSIHVSYIPEKYSAGLITEFKKPA